MARSPYTTLTDLAERISDLESLRISLIADNEKQKTQIESLKETITARQKNAALSNKSEPNNEGRNNTRVVMNSSDDYTVEHLFASLHGIGKHDAKDFVLSMTPKIRGGITCGDMYKILANSIYLDDRDVVIIKIAPYIKRPLPSGCIRNLSSIMPPDKSGNAILILQQSKPLN